VLKAEAPYTIDPVYGGPEYETIASLGSCCGVDDPFALCKANELCNAYSLDTISTGATIAWAMECFEQGLLTLADTGGLELRFGNGQALMTAVEQIAHRQGIGDLLAEGCWRAAQKVGRGSERFAMVVKGQEFPMHEPRFKRGLAIGYAVSPTGADHCHSLHDSGLANPDEEGLLPAGMLRSMGVLQPMALESLGPEKVRAMRYHTLSQVLCNCLTVCIFVPWTLEQRATLVNAATGWDTSAFELVKVGERALALARVFDVREGFTIEDDRLPERSYGPTANGPLAQGGIDRELLREAVQTFYGMMGWDEATGVPRASTLEELDVAWAADCLEEKR
jgi:aldehyde:ferredoxin oxidoreductase